MKFFNNNRFIFYGLCWYFLLIPYAIADKLYMPEGFLADEIEDYIAVLNSSHTVATGTLFVYYDDGARQDFAVEFPPEQRITLSLKGLGVKLETPYATMLETNRTITAAFVHYDHGYALASHLTPTLSRQWGLAEGYVSSWTRDYLTLLNPSSDTAEVNLRLLYQYNYYYYGALPQYFTLRIEPNRRFSVDLHKYLRRQYRNQPYGFTLTSTRPIVAALSHYDDALGDGSLIIATPSSQGNRNGFVANGQVPNNGFEIINVVNPHKYSVDFDVILHYDNSVSQIFSFMGLYNESRRGLNISDLANRDEIYAVEYRSFVSHYNSNWHKQGIPAPGTPVPTLVNFVHVEHDTRIGKGMDGVEFTSSGHTHWEFAEGYRSAPRLEESEEEVGSEEEAGSEEQSGSEEENTPPQDIIEQYLMIYNPSLSTATVDVTLYYEDGKMPTVITMAIGSSRKSILALHEHELVRVEENGIRYGIKVTSTVPVIPYFTHKDRAANNSFGLIGVRR